jgi:hypothetical protein
MTSDRMPAAKPTITPTMTDVEIDQSLPEIAIIVVTTAAVTTPPTIELVLYDLLFSVFKRSHPI